MNKHLQEIKDEKVESPTRIVIRDEKLLKSISKIQAPTKLSREHKSD